MRKMGLTATVEVSHGFKLPSGDEEVLSVARGKKKRIEIGRLVAAADEAATSINELRTYLSRLNSSLSTASRVGTVRNVNGVRVQDPTLVAQKNIAIGEIRSEIRATMHRIAEAEDLISKRDAIERELASLNRVLTRPHERYQ